MINADAISMLQSHTRPVVVRCTVFSGRSNHAEISMTFSFWEENESQFFNFLFLIKTITGEKTPTPSTPRAHSGADAILHWRDLSGFQLKVERPGSFEACIFKLESIFICCNAKFNISYTVYSNCVVIYVTTHLIKQKVNTSVQNQSKD